MPDTAEDYQRAALASAVALADIADQIDAQAQRHTGASSQSSRR